MLELMYLTQNLGKKQEFLWEQLQIFIKMLCVRNNITQLPLP